MPADDPPRGRRSTDRGGSAPPPATAPPPSASSGAGSAPTGSAPGSGSTPAASAGSGAGGDRGPAGGGSAPGDRGTAAQRPPTSAGSAGDGVDHAALGGAELARAVLDAAQARRRAAPPRRRPSSDGGGDPATRRRKRGYTGSGPDPRDPQLFGDVLEKLLKARGWQKPAAEATVFGAWERVVGADIAAHSRPIKLADGELTVEAESTAWATQLRMMAAALLKRIAAEVGHNVVKKLHIHGPAAPSWARGPRRVQGRGPRDTYG